MRILRAAIRPCGTPPVGSPSRRPVLGRLAERVRRVTRAAEAGMNTAEYAVGTLAAVAFAGVLLKVVTSDSIQSALSSLIGRALR